MTDQRRAYTLKCLCGFTRPNHIGRPPKVCPQCGAKPEPDGLNRAMRRKLAREMRKSKGLDPEIMPGRNAIITGVTPDLEPPSAA